MKKYLYTCLFLWFTASSLFAEGTKEIRPLASDSGCISFYDYSLTNYGTAFARYGCPDNLRLNFRVCNLGEKVYFGLAKDPNAVISFRIVAPNGNIVVPAQTVPTSGAGFIASHAQAVAGPAQIVGAGGYNAQTFTPTQTGDYYIEFDVSNPSTTPQRIILFDITVASAANVAIKGRLWSYAWLFSTNTGTAKFEGAFFIYTTDQIVTRLDLNGMRPFLFTVCANSYGVQNTGNSLIDRKSVEKTRDKNISLYPTEYQIFLNDPDINCFPTGTFGKLNNNIINVSGCPGNYTVTMDVDKKGEALITFDLNGIAGFQSGTEDIVATHNLVTGVNKLSWDGIDGKGGKFDPTKSFSIQVDYKNGITHFPVYDDEFNDLGLIVTSVRPLTAKPIEMFWDDSNIPSGTVGSTGCTGQCHKWSNSSYGDVNTINTWWYAEKITAQATYTPNPFTVDANRSSALTGPANDTSFCNTLNSLLLKGTFTGDGTAIWTSKTGGSFTKATDVNSMYTFSASEKTNGLAKVILSTVSNISGCPAVKDSMNITIKPIPTVTVPANQTLCNTNNTVLASFSSTVTGSTYTWTNDKTSIGLAASGTGNIGVFNATNTGSASITATISVTPTAATCIGTPKTFTYTVNPTPTVTVPADQTLCNASNTLLASFGSTVTGSTYTWTNDKTSIGLAASGSGNIGVFNAANSGSAPVTSTISVTPTAATCVGAPKTFTYTVHPTPDIITPANQTVCNNTNTVLANFTSSVTGATFSWTNDKISIGLAVSGTGNISVFNAANTDISAVTATISVIPTAATCIGTPKTFTYTVHPTPDVTTPANQTVCNTTNTVLANFTSAVNGSTYTWTNDQTSIGLVVSGTGNIAAFNAANTGSAPVTATILVTPTAATCVGTPKTFTYTVNPTPDITTLANQTVCNNTNTVLASFTSAVTGATFSWTNDKTSIGLASSGTGDIAAFNATNTTTAAVTATISVIPTAATCVGTTKTFTYTVNSVANVTLPANQTVCNNTNTTLAGFSSNVSGVTFNWTNDKSTIGLGTSGTGNIPVFTAVNTNTSPVVATITVSPVSNCTGVPQTFTYTINPTPDVNLPADQTVCNNTSTALASFTSSVPGTTFDWTNDKVSIGLAATGNGDIPAFTASNTASTAIIAAISVKPSAGSCQGPAKTFTYTVKPTPIVTLPNNQVVCNTASSIPVSFNSTVTGTTFDWTNDNTAIGLSASGSGNIPAFITSNTATTAITANISVTPTALACTGIPQKFTYTINPTPDVMVPADKIICNTTATPFATFTSNVPGTTFAWTNDKTSIGLAASGIDDIPAFIATNNSTTAVLATISVTPSADNCKGTPQSFTITVNPTPSVSVPADTSICETQSSMAIKGMAQNYDVLTWTGGANFSPANTAVSVYTFSAADKLAGSVRLTLQADKAQCAPVSDFITISFEKQALITATDKEICETETSIALTSQITNAVNTIWTTTDGKGTISQNGTNGINYAVTAHDTTLTDVNFAITTDGQVKCPAAAATLKLTLTDRPYIKASDYIVCENTASLALVLQAKNMNSVTWTALNANGTFTKTDHLNGTYAPASADTLNTVKIEVTTVNNPVCSVAKDTFTIHVMGKPVLNINPTLICTNFKTTPVHLTSSHINGITWKNLSGNGTVSLTAPYVYTKGNTDSTLAEIQVQGTTINDKACQPVHSVFALTFISMPTLALDDKKCTETNLILDPMANFTHSENTAAVISWTKDKQDLGLTTPTIAASGAGTYVVNYQYPGCSVSDSIHILPLPVIITKPYNICQGSTDSIGINLIKNALYEWSDGPKGTGLHKRPVAAGSVKSTYTVVVTNTDQCSNTASFNVDYTLKPVLVTTGQSFCKGTTGTASVEVSNLALANAAVTYQWLLNNKDLNLNTNAVTASQAGKYVVKVSFGDCLSKDSVTIQQYGLPVTGMKSSYIYCSDDLAGLQVKAVDGYTYDWTNNHEVTQLLSVTPTENTWYKVILSNQYGCKASDSAFVKISCPPRVFAANVITPEKNDENKYLRVFGDHYKDLELMVYNRWGEVIFKSSPERPDWDGMYAGDFMPIGTYPYTIKYAGKYEEYPGPYKMEGKVTVIK